MGLPEHSADVKSSGLACDTWSCEWTYTDGSGAVLLDTSVGEGGAWTDLDPRIPEATQVADGGTGLTDIKFPRSRRARVVHCSIEPATPGTASNHRQVVVTALNALAGTCRLVIIESDTAAALADPQSGSRGRLVLDLEYR